MSYKDQAGAVGDAADQEIAGLSTELASTSSELASTKDALAAAQSQSASTATPWLAVDLDYKALAASKKRVVASWMPFFPLRLTPTGDYYASNYWTPNPSSAGEKTKWAPYGGYLRDRPLPPASGESMQADAAELMDAAVEIGQAKSAGVDGFLLCMESIATDQPRNWQRCVNMAKAGKTAGGFTTAPMPDMTSGSVKAATAQALAASCVTLCQQGNPERTSTGNVLVTPFMGEQMSAQYWTDFRTAMAAAGFPVDLIPITNSSLSSTAVKAILPVCYGVGPWGGRSPATVAGATNDGKAQHAAGKAWMQYVCIQDQRPKNNVWDEANNTETLRSTWKSAIDTGAEYVHLATWNDYSEGSQFAPSWLRGNGFLDLSAYWLSWYKTGVVPSVVRAAKYVTAKTQMSNATPSLSYPNKMSLRAGSSPARDMVETVVFTPGSPPGILTSQLLAPPNGHLAPRIDYYAPPVVQDEQYLISSSLR